MEMTISYVAYLSCGNMEKNHQHLEEFLSRYFYLEIMLENTVEYVTCLEWNRVLN